MKPTRRTATLLSLVLLAGLTLLAPLTARAQINYQDRLTDANGVALGTGQHTVESSLWDVISGGTTGVNRKWGPFPTTVDVITDGRFNVIIGNLDSNTPTPRSLTTGLSQMPAANPAYLEIKVGANVISPRQQILATPRALMADVIPNVTPNGAGNTTITGNATVTGGLLALGMNLPNGNGISFTNSASDGANGYNFLQNFYGNNTFAIGRYVDGVGYPGDKALVLSAAGNVGIGTSLPTRGKLEVVGRNIATPFAIVPVGQNFSYSPAQAGGLWGQSGSQTRSDIGIYTDNRVVAPDIFVTSDERIKSIIGRSDSALDLQTLLGIEITDYTLKDVIAKGRHPLKKVVAQQVEKVFPQAVSQHTDVVPDIYQKAPVQDGWVELATDLNVGERVRLIGEKEEGIHAVLEVRAGAFRTAFQPATGPVFVYGREVKDFRIVDYEAIAMINVSATQQLKKEQDAEIQTLREQNAALTRRLATMEQASTTLQTRLGQLEQALTTLSAARAIAPTVAPKSAAR